MSILDTKEKDNMADYGSFPFDEYFTAEITQMFMDSVRVSDLEFAQACREKLKQHHDPTEEPSETEHV